MKPSVVVIIIVLIIGLGIGGYFWMKAGKKNSETENVKTPELQETTASNNPQGDSSKVDFSEVFKNDDLKISLKYPKGWKTKDLGGDKNVTEPLVRENVLFVYDPVDPTSEQAKASLKFLRFVLENGIKINSGDDWYNYVKDKVNKFTEQTDLVSEVGYKLISLEKVKDINGHFAVREDYTLKDNVRGRDYYIYATDIYQYVFETLESNFNYYQPIFDTIAQSFSK